MQGDFLRVFRLSGAALAAVLVVFAITAHPAHADPHAMFYTAVGQQQLFFNVLAALDQADYVEPAVDTIGTDANDSREELLKKREAAGIAPESYEPLKATETDLSSILTRPITLEGQDQWTAYQRFQLALEVARRNATDELMRKLCQHATGIAGCDPDSEPNKKLRADVKENLRKQAIVREPVKEAVETDFERGVQAALASGSTGGTYGNDQQKRKDIVKRENGEPVQYYAYDAGVALLRQAASSNPQKQQLVDSLIRKTEAAFRQDAIPAYLVDRINVDNGIVSLEYTPQELSGDDFINNYISDTLAALQLPGTLLAAAQSGASAANISAAADQNGVKADREYNPKVLSDGQRLGTLDTTVEIPAIARENDYETIKDAAAFASANLAYAPAAGTDKPGGDPLVKRPGGSTAGASTGSANSSVLAEQTRQQLDKIEKMQQLIDSGTVANQRVAGLSDWFGGFFQGLWEFLMSLLKFYEFYDQPKPSVPPAVNPTQQFNEEGAADSLFYAGGISPDKQSGVPQLGGTSAQWGALCAAAGICNP